MFDSVEADAVTADLCLPLFTNKSYAALSSNKCSNFQDGPSSQSQWFKIDEPSARF